MFFSVTLLLFAFLVNRSLARLVLCVFCLFFSFFLRVLSGLPVLRRLAYWTSGVRRPRKLHRRRHRRGPLQVHRAQLRAAGSRATAGKDRLLCWWWWWWWCWCWFVAVVVVVAVAVVGVVAVAVIAVVVGVGGYCGCDGCFCCCCFSFVTNSTVAVPLVVCTRCACLLHVLLFFLLMYHALFAGEFDGLR